MFLYSLSNHVSLCLMSDRVPSSARFQVSTLLLINSLVSSPDDLDFRLQLRNEFMRVGLMDILEVSIRGLGAGARVRTAAWALVLRDPAG